jgi:hypothetical protein
MNVCVCVCVWMCVYLLYKLLRGGERRRPVNSWSHRWILLCGREETEK